MGIARSAKGIEKSNSLTKKYDIGRMYRIQDIIDVFQKNKKYDIMLINMGILVV